MSKSRTGYNDVMWDTASQLMKCQGRDSAIAVMQDALARLRNLGYSEEKVRKAEDNLRFVVDGLFPKSKPIKKADRDALEIGDEYLMPSRFAAGIQTLRDGTFDAHATELTLEEYKAMPKPDKREQMLYLLIAAKLPKGESIKGKIESLDPITEKVHFSPKECRVLARAIYGRDDAQSRSKFNKLFATASTPKTIKFYYRDDYRFVSGNVITMSKVTDVHVLKDGTQLVTDYGVTFHPSNLFYYYLERYARVNLKELVEGIRGRNGDMVCTISMAAIAQWASILMRVRHAGEYRFRIDRSKLCEDFSHEKDGAKKKSRQRIAIRDAVETAARALKAKSWACMDDGSVELVFDAAIDTGEELLDAPTEDPS